MYESEDNEGELIHAAILALGGGLQRTQEKTFQGILSELSHTIDYFNKESAQPGSKLFKSRLTFKAISEIFKMVIKKDLGSKAVNRSNIATSKESIGI